jgi:hypothetical protein
MGGQILHTDKWTTLEGHNKKTKYDTIITVAKIAQEIGIYFDKISAKAGKKRPICKKMQ